MPRDRAARRPRRPLLAAVAAAAPLLAAGCRGTVPRRDAPPEQAISAILVSARVLTPKGETRDGSAVVNFEDRGGEEYRLPLTAGENDLYLVEPGTYRLAPPRGPLGFRRGTIAVRVDGRTYRVRFPREFLMLEPYRVKPAKIAVVGVLEARLLPALAGRPPEVRVRLDDGVSSRRALVQDAIRGMMDPSRPAAARDSAIAWSRALQGSLQDLMAEEERFAPPPQAP